MWIRVETNVADNDKVHCFGNFLGISTEEALGFLVRTWGKVAEHRTDGNLEGVLDMTLECWAGWRGEVGLFAKAFRDHFVSDYEIIGWKDRQGKLIARQLIDRERKSQGNSTENPRKSQGNSIPTKRYDTTNIATRNNTWLTPFWDAWLAQYQGEPNGGQLAKALKPLVDQHGADKTLRHWKEYLADNEAKFASPARFKSTFGAWGKKCAEEIRDLRELPEDW